MSDEAQERRRGAGVRATPTVMVVLAVCAGCLILAWTREFALILLALAVPCAGAAALMAARSGAVRGVGAIRAAVGLLVVTLGLGALATHRFTRIEFEWPGPALVQRDALRQALAMRMADVVERGRQAAERAAALTPPDATSQRLEGVRAATGVDALFRLNASSGLTAWAGDHRGLVPEEVRGGIRTFFAERPLFSYLYFAAPVAEGRGTAVAAVLIDAELGGLREGVASAGTSVGRELGVLFRADGAPGEDDWRLIENGDTVVHGRLQPITQASLRSSVESGARRLAVVLVLAALILLGAGWLRLEERPTGGVWSALPLVVLAAGLAVAPLGDAVGLDELFAPSLFVLPLPGDVSLGGFVAPVIALAALVATLRPPILDPRRYGIALAAGTVAVGLAYPATLRLLIEASSPTLLEGGAWLWFGLQTTAVLLLTVVTALALPRNSRLPSRPTVARPIRRRIALATVSAITLGTLLGLGVLWRRDPVASTMPWTAVLWIAPFLVLGLGFARYSGRSGALLRWLAAGALAASAVLPHLWVAQTHARLNAASREVESLGAQLPPIVEFLLVGFGAEVRQQYAQGERGLQLLYRSWVGSGLAGEPYGARITLWSPEQEVVSEVALGGAEGSDAQSEEVRRLVQLARGDTASRVHGLNGVPTISKALTAPLGDGHVVTVSVPPRRTLGRPSVLAPFLGSSPDPELDLNVVEASGGEIPDEVVRWERAPGGYRSDVVVAFPDGLFHAHTRVGLTGRGVLFARGVLLAAFDLLLLAVLWFGGSFARGLSPFPPGAPTVLAASFRARVTLALFAFFLVPTALFGWVAYRGFAGEVERAARTISARAVRQAVQEFQQSQGNLRLLADRIGAEVLYYYNSGELAQASSPEAVGLGVYSAWMSPETHRTLASGEEPAVEEVRRLGEEQYLVAYRAIRPAGVYAVPTSLSSGETAIRQRELAHLILFAAVMGALLSFGLSIFVGRALAGPIGRLRRAAAQVGAGRLRVRLPERQGDEFGEVYASFNRMVRRLRRARVRERETARVLAWGEMAQQVAHEIKNPLTPIKLSVQHLRRAHRDRRPDYDRVLDESVDQILLEIDRLTDIARSFSRFGTQEAQAPLEAVDVPDIVREALTLYRSSADAIRYEDELAPDLPHIIARRNEVKEVLLNLVENAREALDGPGRITVRASSADGRVDLEVEDDGPGIPPDQLSRVFDPHFSTRSTGTGLGLAIVRRLVESWGGSVTAQSEPGRGTTVRLRLEAANGQRAR